MIRSSMAGSVAGLARLPRASAVVGSKAETCEVRMLWWNSARRSQSVILSEVPKLPARMREKFDKPVALGIMWGGISASVRAVSGTKKLTTPKPNNRHKNTKNKKETTELKLL